MTNPKWEEQILVVPVAELFAGRDSGDNEFKFQGVQDDPYAVSVIHSNIERNLKVMRRGNSNDPTPKENNAEINVDYKQPIPYAVLKRGSEIFVYERLSGGGEARLHNQLSIGVGGHMNPTPKPGFNDSLYLNLGRELIEELKFSESLELDFEIFGLINDDSEEVSKVHIGVLTVLDVPETMEITVRETKELLGYWVPIEGLKTDKIYDRLEGWSKLAVDVLSL